MFCLTVRRAGRDGTKAALTVGLRRLISVGPLLPFVRPRRATSQMKARYLVIRRRLAARCEVLPKRHSASEGLTLRDVLRIVIAGFVLISREPCPERHENGVGSGARDAICDRDGDAA